MNLHDIKRQNLDLLMEYMRERYGWTWRYNTEGNGLDYDVYGNNNYTTLNRAEAEGYEQDALRWLDQGRPRLR